ncbi:MAG: DUF805 domain-containing protein [Candidatus Aphodosoma sp.]
MAIATPTLGFVEALNAATSKIFQMKGRSRRSEFWWTQLLVYISGILLTPIVGNILSLLTIPLKVRRLHDVGRSGWWIAISVILNIFFFIIMCAIIIKYFVSAINSVYFDFSALMSLLLNYLVFGIIVWIYNTILLVFYCMDSKPGPNAYGPSPKYVEEVETEMN